MPRPSRRGTAPVELEVGGGGRSRCPGPVASTFTVIGPGGRALTSTVDVRGLPTFRVRHGADRRSRRVQASRFAGHAVAVTAEEAGGRDAQRHRAVEGRLTRSAGQREFHQSARRGGVASGGQAASAAKAGRRGHRPRACARAVAHQRR